MAKRPSLSSEFKHADTWRAFHQGAGRAAIGALMVEFGLYGVAPPGVTGDDALRREGQRDVLMRIVQLIGLKAEAAPLDAWEDADILDRITRGD